MTQAAGFHRPGYLALPTLIQYNSLLSLLKVRQALRKMYGFQSYISVPIYRSDGRFFGTLCAIDRAIQSEFALSRPVVCDSARIAQLLSNLLANAFIH
jgi:GAF domain-containing protein